MRLNLKLVEPVVRGALREDIGRGDITTLSLIKKDTLAKGKIVAKEEGVLAGLRVAKLAFTLLDERIKFKFASKDGEKIKANQILAEIEGQARAVLSAERTALNFLQRLSGIATKTAKLVKETSPHPVKILDTRKTTPGMRYLEKYAVRVGGGENHRFGLFDGILIKDNHIKITGGIKSAVNLIKKKRPSMKINGHGGPLRGKKIEVEVENLREVKEALKVGADIIMLDNMRLREIKRAVEIIGGKALIEVSGKVNQQNIKKIAKYGVNFISLGILTHSVKSLDISLEVEGD